MKLAIGIVIALCAIARAEEPAMTVGLSASAVESISVGGNVGGASVGEAKTTGIAKLYGDYRVLPDLHVGLAVPVGVNAPGPTSNEYDVGIALRVRFDLPPASYRPYLFAEPGLMYAKLPGGEWWDGHAVAGGAGVRLALDTTWDFVAEATVKLTSISGTVNYPSQFDPLMSGSVRVAYLGVALGIEAH